MKILGIIGISIAFLILLILLALCVKISLSFELIFTEKDKMKFNGKIRWLFISKSIGNKKKKLKDKKSKKGKKEKNKKGNIVSTIKNICIIIGELKWIPQKVLTIEKQGVWCKVALEDPMKCGIIFGILSGSIMTAVGFLANYFKTKWYKVRVTPDFKDKDGISVKDITSISFRPLFLIICLCYAYTKSEILRKTVKTLMENNKKGRSKDE
ncbi:MAG: DUF2953 domain-containing protein [Clostridia bacterium]|nr:DUF2953 domain-containing protein [Clostridia bacterium]